jgi:hypothetical protein
MVAPHFTIDRDRVAEVCRRHRVHRLSLFGSALTPSFNAESDVDFLVEFAAETRPTFFDLAALEAELSTVIGRRIDLRTPKELSRYFRDQVIASAVLQYAA